MKSLAMAGAISISLIFSSAIGAKAQGVDLVGAGVVGLVGSKLIDKATKAAQDLIAQGEQSGNALMTKAGNELAVLTQNINLQIGDDIRKITDAMNQQEQQLATALGYAIKDAQAMVSQVYEMKDTFVIDLAAREADLPLTNVPDFFVQSIRGVAFLQRPGDYVVSLFARGVGVVSNQKTTISVTLNGAEVPIRRIDQLQAGRADIFIPQAALDPLFKKDTLATAPLILTVKLSKKHWYGWRDATYPVPLTVTLYPKLAAKAVAKWQNPTYGWVGVEDAASNPINTPNRDGCRDQGCRFTGTADIRVPGPVSGPPVLSARRLHDSYWVCLTNTSVCDFKADGPQSIDQNGTHLVRSLQTWSLPTTWQLRAKTDEWRQTGSDSGQANLTFYFDQQASLQVPTAAAQVTLQVTTFTGRTYALSVPAVDPEGILKMVSRAAGTPGNDNIILSAGRPAGVP